MTKLSSILPRDFALALFTAVVWALSFAVLKAALAGTPPFLLGAARFLLAAVPAIFFFKAPKVPSRLYAAFGMTTCFGQFALLVLAMHAGMPSGIASLVMQSHAFFTLVFAAIFLGEKWSAGQLIGLLVALGGLALLGTVSDGYMQLLGFILSLGAALLWSLGNISSRYVSRCGPINQLAFVVWSSLIPVLPLLLLSYLFEGGPAISLTITQLNWSFVGAVAYMAWGSTLFGYAAWNYLLSRYPANQIAPFTLFVPIVALYVGWLLFDERLKPVHFFGCGLVMIGLIINLFGANIFSRICSRLFDST